MLGSGLSLLRGRLDEVEELVRIGQLKDNGLDEHKRFPFLPKSTSADIIF